MHGYGNLLPCLDHFYNKGKFLVLYRKVRCFCRCFMENMGSVICHWTDTWSWVIHEFVIYLFNIF